MAHYSHDMTMHFQVSTRSPDAPTRNDVLTALRDLLDQAPECINATPDGTYWKED